MEKFDKLLKWVAKIDREFLAHFIVGLILAQLFAGLMMVLGVNHLISYCFSASLVYLIVLMKEIAVEPENAYTLDVENVGYTMCGAFVGELLLMLGV